MAEVGATGALNTRYIRGTGLVAREVDSALQYYLFDAHGDVLHRLDASGNMLKTYRYDAFGNEIDPEPLDTNPFRYCGEYFDREIGTYYLRARNYNPRIGRFTTEDVTRSATVSLPGDKKAVDPLSLNLYAYCRNNPVRFTDPTGNAAYDGVSYPVSGGKSNRLPSYWPVMNDSAAYKNYKGYKGGFAAFGRDAKKLGQEFTSFLKTGLIKSAQTVIALADASSVSGGVGLGFGFSADAGKSGVTVLAKGDFWGRRLTRGKSTPLSTQELSLGIDLEHISSAASISSEKESNWSFPNDILGWFVDDGWQDTSGITNTYGFGLDLYAGIGFNFHAEIDLGYLKEKVTEIW